MMRHPSGNARVALERGCNELVSRNGVFGICGCVATHLIIIDWRCPAFRALSCVEHAADFGGHAISLRREPSQPAG